MESALVALSLQLSGIESQIKTAERRAALRCSEYNPIHEAWKIFDNLMENQAKVMSDMPKLSTSMMKKIRKRKILMLF